MCNSSNQEGLREVLGLAPVSDYLHEHRLFKDRLLTAEGVFLDFADLDMQYPVTGKMREDLFTRFVQSDEKVEKMLKRARLIPEGSVVNSCKKEKLENGYSGVIYRIKDVLLDQGEMRVPSVILKICFAQWHPDVKSEATLLHTLSGLYTRPLLPHLYLHLSNRGAH